MLVAFGAAGRESVQQLMNAPNWEVRRTAAFLLREFGGAEGLKELQPLLTDSEPLVQREAIQALVLNGTEAASQILVNGAQRHLRTSAADAGQRADGPAGRARRRRCSAICAGNSIAAQFAARLHRRDRRARSFGGARRRRGAEGRAAARRLGAPLRTRRTRAAAAQALRRIGTPAARRRRCATRHRHAAPRGVARGARKARAGSRLGWTSVMRTELAHRALRGPAAPDRVRRARRAALRARPSARRAQHGRPDRRARQRCTSSSPRSPSASSATSWSSPTRRCPR